MRTINKQKLHQAEQANILQPGQADQLWSFLEQKNAMAPASATADSSSFVGIIFYASFWLLLLAMLIFVGTTHNIQYSPFAKWWVLFNMLIALGLGLMLSTLKRLAPLGLLLVTYAVAVMPFAIMVLLFFFNVPSASFWQFGHDSLPMLPNLAYDLSMAFSVLIGAALFYWLRFRFILLFVSLYASLFCLPWVLKWQHVHSMPVLWAGMWIGAAMFVVSVVAEYWTRQDWFAWPMVLSVLMLGVNSMGLFFSSSIAAWLFVLLNIVLCGCYALFKYRVFAIMGAINLLIYLIDVEAKWLYDKFNLVVMVLCIALSLALLGILAHLLRRSLAQKKASR